MAAASVLIACTPTSAGAQATDPLGPVVVGVEEYASFLAGDGAACVVYVLLVEPVVPGEPAPPYCFS